jgi:hypothetical protein
LQLFHPSSCFISMLPQQPGPAMLRRSRPAAARALQTAAGIEVRALEAAVGAINKIVTRHEARRAANAQEPAQGGAGGGKPAARGKAKTFAAKAKAQSKRVITVGAAAAATQHPGRAPC